MDSISGSTCFRAQSLRPRHVETTETSAMEEEEEEEEEEELLKRHLDTHEDPARKDTQFRSFSDRASH
ncbi:hypothetical protein TgHK011_009869 [Trichoderma gracile]|nr:hypothetical protein TgHK011_009869 [Trichoderma gracile]